MQLVWFGQDFPVRAPRSSPPLFVQLQLPSRGLAPSILTKTQALWEKCDIKLGILIASLLI